VGKAAFRDLEADLLDGRLEFLPVLRFFDGAVIGSDEFDAVLFQDTALGKVVARLSPVCPPRVGRITSGFSFLMISSITSV